MTSALDAVSDNIVSVFHEYFASQEQVLVEQNIMQMRKGLMPDGEPIMPGYTWGGNYYAYRKRYVDRYNQFDLSERPYLTPNLGLTGAFYSGISIVHGDEHIHFTSTDPKWESAIEGYHGEANAPLSERYGDVLGVPQEYMAESVMPEIKNNLIEKIRETLDI